MILEKPFVEFVALRMNDTIATSGEAGETSCVRPTAHENNCSYYTIDGGFMGHGGSYDGKCSSYTFEIEDD